MLQLFSKSSWLGSTPSELSCVGVKSSSSSFIRFDEKLGERTLVMTSVV